MTMSAVSLVAGTRLETGLAWDWIVGAASQEIGSTDECTSIGRRRWSLNAARWQWRRWTRGLVLAECCVACCVAGGGVARAASHSQILLAGGDEALLVPPVAQFRAELQRMTPARPVFPALLSNDELAQQTADADRMDLEIALRRSGLEGSKAKRILDEYATVRAAIVTQVEAGEAVIWGQQPPLFVPPGIPEQLPVEFEDYLRGALSWHAGQTNDARRAWERLLERPAAQRPFRSTWAAFMLGKSYSEREGPRAIRYYRQVRELARAGFADSLGLAASSIGWEAQVEYHRGRHERAIELYLEQLASTDPSAVNSLRWVAGDALRSRVRSLRGVARHAPSRRVITAYVISGGFDSRPVDVDGPVTEVAAKLLSRLSLIRTPSNGWHSLENPAVRWVKALDSAGAKDSESAERLALAAYQCGQFEIAQRWIPNCRTQPVARWLQAKLWLREGRLGDAEGLLATLSGEFPTEPTGNDRPIPTGLLGQLWVEANTSPQAHSRDQILGELGAVHLARKRYVESLECLLRGGFWVDAAYVAERVLTVEELKQFVDQHGTLWTGESRGLPEQQWRMGGLPPREQEQVRWEELRYLLGRRLTRVQRGEEATRYYPGSLREAQRSYAENLKNALAPDRPVAERAGALWAAAQLARAQGLELLGTEVEPDWAIYEGQSEGSVSMLGRAGRNAFVRASWDEMKRARRHGPSPPERYHYRYRAAVLAWEAAKLMPDNSDDTARVLCRAGSWLKNCDPTAADVFYKALVRRCRHTELGRLADRKRWFPAVE